MKNTTRILCGLLLLILPAGSLAENKIAPAAKDKCAICGMFVAKYPDWSAMIEYKNGRRVWFDGVKDLLKGYVSPARYGLPKERSDIKAVWVKDYYSLSFTDGRTALYVVGSDILGPMGKDLIPFAREKDARGFQTDHQGEKVLRFDQLNADILKKLD
jgi:nitrous oxide reductase accessory protein NosL